MSIATVHLLLIELTACAYYYFAFAMGASVFVQFMRPMAQPPVHYRRRKVARMLYAAGVAAALCATSCVFFEDVLVRASFATVVPSEVVSVSATRNTWKMKQKTRGIDSKRISESEPHSEPSLIGCVLRWPPELLLLLAKIEIRIF